MTRVPRPLLFGLAALLQVAAVGWIVIDRATILGSATQVLLETAPVDPRDFLRGDYVVLRYDISSVAAGTLENRPASHGAPVYVVVAPGADGFHRVVSVHASRPTLAPGQVALRGRVDDGDNCGPKRRSFCSRLRITYGLESFFVPEGEGRELERVRDDRKVSVVAAVDASGRAAIKRLMVDDKPVYDEPLL